jgi:hypothetical protein
MKEIIAIPICSSDKTKKRRVLVVLPLGNQQLEGLIKSDNIKPHFMEMQEQTKKKLSL